MLHTLAQTGLRALEWPKAAGKGLARPYMREMADTGHAVENRKRGSRPLGKAGAMVESRSETVARRLAFGLLVLAGGIFAASAGLGFGMFLPGGAPPPTTIGKPRLPDPQAH